MASRGGSISQPRRAPLGDATDRINNASPKKPQKQVQPQDNEHNPLRANPVDLQSHRFTTSRSSSRASKSVAGRSRPSSHIRASTISQEEADDEKRNSQFSNSSGASSGRKTHVGPWQLGKTLGKGSAARVRLARHHITHELVAVKILAKNGPQLTQAGSLAEVDKWDRSREEFTAERHMPLSVEREVAILKLIDHPNIVKLYDIWENRSEIYIVLENMEKGDLFAYINHRGPLPEYEMMHYFRQLMSALEYVHSFNICHRDLKPENILMKDNGQVKIADFGMAAMQQSPNHALRTSCGSPHYAAPELIGRSRYRGDKVDIWSLGVILYACLSARLPFDDPDGDVHKILARAIRRMYYYPDWISVGARDLIDKMLTVDPKLRISIKQMWQHPLIRNHDDLDDLNDGGESLESWKKGRCQPVPREDIDKQALRQLKAIWHTFSEKSLAARLTSSEPNDQKLFYWLLCEYREKRLENYDTDLTYSASDYHHLRPTNWKKKYTTLEFPSKYGRTPSRFTVISNVASDDGSEAAETATDGGHTVQSYDPYKSSRMREDPVASRARIVIHRNRSSAKESTRSVNLTRMHSGSIRSTSTYSRSVKNGRYITAPAATRSSRRSLSSIRSGDGASYTRPASRHKRGIDFSRIRRPSTRQPREPVPRPPASIAGDDTTYDRDYMSPTGSVRRNNTSRNPGGRTGSGTQSMANVLKVENDMLSNEEIRQFSHSIAKDCDDAFNSTLLSPQSYLSANPFESSIADDNESLPISASTPTPYYRDRRGHGGESRPWDSRPLPPTPEPTDSVRREIKMAKQRAGQYKTHEHAKHAELMESQLNLASQPAKTAENSEADRRASSAPIYSQYSTQRGRDIMHLPSIHEGSREDNRTEEGEKPRIASAPARPMKGNHNLSDERAGLEYLARQENTIRIVNSPSNKQSPVKAPAPLNIRKKLSRGVPAHQQSQQELNLRQQYMNQEKEAPVDEEPSTLSQQSSSTAAKMSSWFKRSSKDKDDMFHPRVGSGSTWTDRLTHTDSNSSSGPSVLPVKKKSISLAFWRSSKDEPQMSLSLADDTDFDDSSSPEPSRMFSHPARPPHGKKWEDAASKRNIEPHQNWLARLFRVKPATKHICFTIPRRRVRQEIASMLRVWRKYGIRDVQVDKERNLVFARVGKKNYLDMKEVSFAAEIMTVIEHGKRSQLCIVRFTQERGAASSFHKVIDTLEAVFSARNLLVTDKRKIKMMIKTLNS
ncbi:hypothetical protein F5X96DRAFT_687144 [Biscogniauxia mediterranea]|nr:hypothetical protein F5X96DRAFT_687144 [Biscogniauxia mediterranea]